MDTAGGIILCGGQSKRMGRPKAWLPFGDELMLQRMVRLMATVVEPIVVVAAPDQELPPLPPKVRVARDEERGRGPLQGLSMGLATIRDSAEAAYVSSCDVPFLEPAFVHRMIGLLGSHQISVPRALGHHHPLAAVYRPQVVTEVDRLLAEDRLRPFFLFEAVPTRIVEEDELRDVDPTLESLRNLNTPEDYEMALRALASSG
jgi:molybdopterin-guanine dinucleotide biosynthesis protein A